MLLLVAGRRSGLITVEKERDCWISLISTPLTGGEIMRGKDAGQSLLRPVGLFCLLFAWTLGIVVRLGFIMVVAGPMLAFFLCSVVCHQRGAALLAGVEDQPAGLGFTLGAGSSSAAATCSAAAR